MQLLSGESRKSLEDLCSRYQANLTEQAVAYWQGRGLPMAAVKHYRLGVVDAESPDHPEAIDFYSIPYLTRSGVVGFSFRNPRPDGEPKYLTAGSKRLFNTLAMDKADRTGTLAICEGEVDAMTVDFLCDIPAVGIPGVETYKAHPEWRELFRGYSQVLIFRDNDVPRPKPGKPDETWQPGHELAKQLRADIDTSRVIQLPAKDVNETYCQHGAEAIRKLAGLEAA